MFKFFKRKPPAPELTDTLGYLSRFYSTRCDEDRRLDTRHGQVEYLTTMRYIERYLQPGMKILEIGAATGRYSLTLARMGYDVTAIELVQHNIDIFRKKLRPGDKIDLQQGDALDLSRFDDNTFDMTLLLGPMYHLYTQEDQSRALREALRMTKPGGLLYAAYVICDMAILESGIGAKKWFWDYLEDGHIIPETYECISNPGDLFQLCRREDIDALTAPLPCARLHYIATDGVAQLNKSVLAEMTPAQFAKFMDYHYFICERPDMAGATNHSLDILIKH
ncbi:MAG: class I SAM-dependent methyltransferase [Firmicutes bacterium]|nr:class I SAM-dependent methyltransferase [Bacillota bacterium]